MRYKFRYLKPEITDWIEHEGTSEIDAIQEHQLQYRIGYRVKLGIGHFVYFARVETPSGEQYISRVFHHGLERKGGVSVRHDPYPWGYEEAAAALGVTVEYLSQEGSWEQAEQEYH